MPRSKKQPVIVDGIEHWVCNKCERPLPAEEYYKSKASPNGLQSYCKDCVKAYNKSRHVPAENDKRFRRPVEVDGKTLWECTKCKTPKEATEFSPYKGSRSGLNSWCKKCCAEYTKERRRAKKAEASTGE